MEKKFDNVSFFRSKRNGDPIAQISVLGSDMVILVPNGLKRNLPLQASLTVTCTKLKKGKGYMLVRYEPYIPKIDILLSRDKRDVTVLNAGVVTAYSYSISGKMTPRQFYEHKRQMFRNEYDNDNLTRKWKIALQDISYEFSKPWDIDEFEVIPMFEPLESIGDVVDDREEEFQLV